VAKGRIHSPWHLAAALIAAAGAWHGAAGLYLPAKALLAQALLARAWSGTVAGGGPVRPWPWADTWPVARLAWPGADPVVVLSGGSGRTLAFGPGQLAGSAAPGRSGHSVIAAHRDTHFRGLDKLRPGSTLRVERPDGVLVDYRVVATGVVDSTREELVRQDADGAWLTLVTCYPFNAMRPGGPLRYLVHARAVD